MAGPETTSSASAWIHAVAGLRQLRPRFLTVHRYSLSICWARNSPFYPRISSLLAPELEDTLRTNPAHAAELAEELHAADLAELIDGLGDETGAKMVAALPVPAAAAALDAMDPLRRVQIFGQLDRELAATIADAMSAWAA